ncbi:hypothetical protein RRG08_030256 [Elysia crispata]|uniref:Uncharacterized protein n=1 Tax=Elysia crispata TaxID=231223 RepID=A0AAE1AIZ6_9GAST|nr:hypothetical protein RRG08_030256 [Elysia crispata]
MFMQSSRRRDFMQIPLLIPLQIPLTDKEIRFPRRQGALRSAPTWTITGSASLFYSRFFLPLLTTSIEMEITEVEREKLGENFVFERFSVETLNEEAALLTIPVEGDVPCWSPRGR